VWLKYSCLLEAFKERKKSSAETASQRATSNQQQVKLTICELCTGPLLIGKATHVSCGRLASMMPEISMQCRPDHPENW
jgi:RNase P subunit RPR2